MSILLTGPDGQVGGELRATLRPLGDVVVADRSMIDLADPESIRRTIRDRRPELVVNAAAYTAVDAAESEPDLAEAVNATGPGILAAEAAAVGAGIVHYSTDYVFDGSGSTPRRPEDATGPLGVYGRTKLAGERAVAGAAGDVGHLVLRTAWVYGRSGRNFMLTMLRLAEDRTELRVVDDQHGSPTWSRSIARGTAAILAACGAGGMSRHRGVHHLTCGGQTTWCGFARAIMEHAGLDRSVIPITTADFPTPAKRPAYSVLDCASTRDAFGVSLPHWTEALAEASRDAS